MKHSKKNLKFSIICPVFNSSLYLADCINSVVNQSYKNWELILVNDGSTDNSKIICDEFSKHYDNILTIHKENQGQYFARIDGLKKATGDYILFLDSDDYLDENTLKNLFDNLNIDADVVVFNMKCFSNDNLVERQFFEIKENKVILSDEVTTYFFCEAFITNLCRCCFKNIVLQDYKIDNRFGKSKIGEDTIFMFSIIKNITNCLLLPKTLYFYRMHINSATHKVSFDNAIQRVEVLNHVYSSLNIPDKYVCDITMRVGWSMVTAINFACLTSSYCKARKKFKYIRKLFLYENFFKKFKTESSFFNLVVFLFKNKFYFMLTILIKLFRKKIAI